MVLEMNQSPPKVANPMANIKLSMASSVPKIPKEDFYSKPSKTIGATGLSNLGNTCFMNSALQCLSNTGPLTAYMLSQKWKEELNSDNPLGLQGRIAKSYATLMLSLWQTRSDRPAHIAPRNFKETIGTFNSMFGGYSQQDSQELLQSLLDGLHEDLNRVLTKPYVEIPDMDTDPDYFIAKKSWEIYCLRNDSIIVDLFQGNETN